jgi:hypothetical protein
MSNPTETLASVPSDEAVVKQSFIQRRIVTPIKNHPKIALAVVGGLALVGAAALVAKNDDSTSSNTEEPTEELVEDTTVA